MPLDFPRVRQCFKDFDFRRMFTQELGWDHHKSTVEVTVEGRQFTLVAVAEKRGMVAYNCAAPDADGILPYALRRKIERQVSKSVHEHIIIFTDQPATTQVWQWVKREVSRPTACREHSYHRSQPGDGLLQKLQALEFSLEEEENLTVVDVAGRARAAFDVDRVTKRFYERFKAEHAAFLKFIKGIPSEDDQAWYASLMLNRLMFVYFIQKKRFLDNDPDYLRHRLLAMQQQHGKDKFYSFYRQFLLRLFHEGLNQPLGNRAVGLDVLIGIVPYLNGGLFDVHQLEERNPEIAIPDKAFERLFDFFDAYQWHLDERPLRADNEINPDVLGYIFEKYINQKQMGAYYTKEDITGYIAQNTVIPFLFDAAEKKCQAAFRTDSPLWGLLREDPDRYIYPAVRHGVDLPLPKAIADRLDHVSKRDGWNKPAPAEFALPTETWREHVARRNRCLELRRKLAAAEVHSINDLITLNLDIRQFAQDAVENCETPELLRAFYRAICSVSVLDPTCGSGAFLFAALNVLEPLYEACLERMQAFINEPPSTSERGAGGEGLAGSEGVATRRLLAAQPSSVTSPEWLAAEEATAEAAEPKAKGKPTARAAKPKQFSDFRRTLAQVADHPSPRYFILKSIIIGNLYGVDIMEEAVEICKLRLFLKLVAQLDRVEQVEPLPDVDFNIRAGNTLVGYVSLDEIREAVERERGGQKKLAFSDAQEDVAAIEEKAEIVDRAYQRFREMQTEQGMDATQFHEAKVVLRHRLDELGKELDGYLAAEYGADRSSKEKCDEWRRSHQPFHWFAEFYGLMKSGCFDVIVGNPPYVEIPKSLNRSLLLGAYETALERWSRDEDLYTLLVERSLAILAERAGRFGMILPLSLAFSTKKPFSLLRQKLTRLSRNWWWSHFDRIPSALFGNEVRTRCTISISGPISCPTRKWLTTSLNRWPTERRDSLFALLAYASVTADWTLGIPKVGSQVQADVLAVVSASNQSLSCDLPQAIPFDRLLESAPDFPQASVYVGGTAYNWFPVWRDVPPTTTAEGHASLPARTAGYRFNTEDEADAVFAVLASSLGYWWWAVASDGFNLKKWLIERFPLSLSAFPNVAKIELATLGRALRKELKRHYVYKDNKGRIGNYFLPACKREVRAIDDALAAHLPALGGTFFDDVRLFNASFSRAEQPDDDSDDDS